MSGAPSQLDMWDYKPKMTDWYDKDLPDSIRNGSTDHHDDVGAKTISLSPRRFSSLTGTANRALGQRVAAAHRRHRRRSGGDQNGQHRSDQSRPGDHLHPNRQPIAGPSQHRRLVVVRTGQHERKLACVCGLALHREWWLWRASVVRAIVGRRFSFHPAPRCQLAIQWRSRVVSFQSRWDERTDATADAGRTGRN